MGLTVLAETKSEEEILADCGISIEVIRTDDPRLIYDRKYQREVKAEWVRAKAASGWDMVKAGYILVNIRKGDAVAVVDGQQRINIARIAGEMEILARVTRGLTQQREAELYLAVNNEVNKQTVSERFKAAHCAEQTGAVAIYDVVHAFGHGIAGIDGKSQANLNAIAALEYVYLQGGKEALRRTLRLLKDAFGGLSRHTTQSGLLVGVYTVMSWHPTIDLKRLARRLGEEGTDALRRLAINATLGGASAKGFYLAAISAFNKNLPEGSRIDPKSRSPVDAP